MKNVLMLTFSWPPRGGTGAWRPLKFAKYLPRFQWRPTVLAAAGWGSADRKYAPAEACHGCEAHAVWPWGDDLLAHGVGFLAAPLLALLGKRRDDFEQALAWRTRRWLTYPTPRTDYNRWVLPFAAAAVRHARTGKYDAIYVTSPPDGMALAAGIIARMTLVPVVIDFRDPWSQNFQSFYRGWRRRLSEALEAWSVRGAARVVVVTERQREGLASLLPREAAKIRCITNGFDPDDLPANVWEMRRSDRFVVALAGTSYEDPRELFEGVRLAASADAEFARRFTFQWMRARPEAAAIARELGIEANVELLPAQPRPRALELGAAADALWLEVPMVPGGEYVDSSKAFEYLGLRRPIIGTAPEAASGRTLVERGCKAKLIASRDPADIARLLAQAFADALAGRLRAETDEAYIAQFRRDVLAGRLADVLNGTA